MRAWINDKIQLIVFIRHIFPCILKNVMGRWFYFRDTPTWVVTKAATLEYKGDDPVMSRFIEEAQRELKSRIDKLEKQVKTPSPPQTGV